jgi:hypothetical protein
MEENEARGRGRELYDCGGESEDNWGRGERYENSCKGTYVKFMRINKESINKNKGYLEPLAISFLLVTQFKATQLVVAIAVWAIPGG